MKFNFKSNCPATWNEKKLKEVCEFITSGGTPSRKNLEFYKNGTVLWVKTKELNDNLVLDTEERITKQALEKSSAKLLPENTILLAMYGATVGKLGILGVEAACNQACCAIFPKEKIADSKFLYYLLMAHREKIIAQASGAAQQNLNGQQIKEFTFDFPPYAEQLAISRILWNVDNKITNNNHLSKTLEKMTEAIFKSWFIDFDPIKAKMRGEKPAGMDEETAALFPDSFEESELGLIPKGWTCSSLKTVMTLEKTSTRVGSEIESKPYVPIDQISSKNIFLSNWLPGSLAKTSLISFKKNDILFGAMRPYFHKVALAPFDGTTRSTTFVLRPKKANFLAYILFLLFQNEAIEYATNHSQGTTIPYAVWSNSFENFPIVLPSAEIIRIYNSIVMPFIEFGYSLIKENESLKTIRDSLLPRLISGELQIPEEMLAS